MEVNKIKIIGNKFLADFGDYLFELHFESETKLIFTSLKGDKNGYSETVQITV